MYNLKVHQRNKHGNQQNESQLKTSYMQDYPQPQHVQKVQQQPIHHRQIPPPPHTQINTQQNLLINQNRYLLHKVNELEAYIRNQNVQTGQTFRSTDENESETMSDVMETDKQDSMDTDSVDSDNKSVSTDVDEDEEQDNVDNLNDKINKIRYALLEFQDLRDDYRSELENVKNYDEEQLRDVLKNYADLEVEILEEQVGVDPEENGEENVEDESVDNNIEEKDTCTCEKGCFLDFVFELRNVIQDDEKEILENLIEKKKREVLEIKESENNENEERCEDEPEGTTKILQKDVTNFEEVCDKFKEDGGECFKDCSKSKSVSNMCEQMNDSLVWNGLKRKYPNKYSQLNKTIQKVRKDGLSELTNPHVTIHKKRKTLQKAQVGEGILNIVKNLIVPELKEALNIR